MTDAAAANGNGRLDRIEANLETVGETLVRVARVVENNRGDIDQIFERLDQLSASVGELRQSQQVLTERFDGLAQMMAQFVQNAEADRAVMREMQLEVRGIQTENRRILDHLFGVEDEQQDNGS